MIEKLSKSMFVLGFATLVSFNVYAGAPSAAAPKDTTSASNDAHTPPATGEPPFSLDDPARIAAGKARFGANCAAYCHGNEGSGGRTPAFKGRKDLNSHEVFRIITEGRKGADVMPAWGNGFSAEKRWELVAYIMHLSRQKPDE